ncbi:MAG: hypothetical protein E6G01_06140 [Actinobacteria bacterium]|nr:MAG: hypothetical protein E6G01_06140 [Actinomycetota bacterium]
MVGARERRAGQRSVRGSDRGKGPLGEYERKRNFGRTAEPKGRKRSSDGRRHQTHFVIQQHDASRMHYDVRLEVDGVMRSWAALDSGHATVWLEGKKLRGGFALTRIRTGKKASWLFVKMDDDGADPRRNPVRTEPRSVLTGRTVEEVCAESDPSFAT